MPPSDLGSDPLTQLGQSSPTSVFVHWLDVEVDPETGIAWVAGIPGLAGYSFGPDGVVPLGVHPHDGAGAGAHYDRIEVLGGGLLAAGTMTAEPPDFAAMDVWPALGWIFDVSDPAEPYVLSTIDVPEVSAMAAWGEVLYLTTWGGDLASVDLSDPAAPEIATILPGLDRPREIVVRGDLAYVAEPYEGVTVVDLADPFYPTVVRSVATAGSAKDLVVQGDLLYVAVGPAGFEVFELSDPRIPKSLGATPPLQGSVASVSPGEGVLWTATQAGLEAWDVTDPSDPHALAFDATDQFALHVAAVPGGVWLTDWERVERWAIDLGRHEPVSGLSVEELWLSGGEPATFEVRNHGSKPLALVGAAVDPPGYEVVADRLEVPAGETAKLELAWKGSGAPPAASICLATTDPAMPVRSLPVAPVADWQAAISVGEPAPDFVLPDLDGELHRLSDLAGRPLLLISFATWCPQCMFELPEVETLFHQAFDPSQLVVWGLAGKSEDAGVVRDYVEKLGLTFPILFDDTEEVIDEYTVKSFGQSTPYPQDVLVGVDGTVVYTGGTWEPAAIVTALEAELGKSAAPAPD